MTRESGFWILTIEIRDAFKAREIIDDLRFMKDHIDWQATDTATIWDEEVKEELETILHQNSIEFEFN